MTIPFDRRRALGAILLIATAITVWYGWHQIGHRSKRIVLENGGGPPILSLVYRRCGVHAVEAWDPRDGKRWTVVDGIGGRAVDSWLRSVTTVHEGSAVAWVDGSTIHLVKCQPPFTRRSWTLRGVFANLRLIGLSADNRFAVLNAGDVKGQEGIIGVQLETGAMTFKETGVLLEAASTDGQFRDCRDEAEYFNDDRVFDAQLNEQGKLIRKNQRKHEYFGLTLATTPTEIPTVHEATFKYRELEDFLRGDFLREPISVKVRTRSPTGRQFAAKLSRGFLQAPYPDPYQGDHFVVARVDTLTGHKLEWPADRRIEDHYGPSPLVWSPDETTIATTDEEGNVYQFECASGRLVARDPCGDRQREHLRCVLGLTALLAGVWIAVALCERSSTWSLVAASAAVFFIPWGVTLFVAQSQSFGEWTTTEATSLLPLLRKDYVATKYVLSCLVGATTGIAACAGWFASYGRGSIWTRWPLAAALVALAILPTYVVLWYVYTDLYGDGPDDHNGKCLAILLAFAMGVATFAAFPRLFGWRLARPNDLDFVRPEGRRFGLAAIFTTITWAAMILAVGRWLYAGGVYWPDTEKVLFQGNVIVVALLFPPVFFFRGRWAIWPTLTVVAAVVVIDAIDWWRI